MSHFNAGLAKCDCDGWYRNGNGGVPTRSSWCAIAAVAGDHHHQAWILPTAANLAVSNQATFAYDADLNGTNETTGLSDDPRGGWQRERYRVPRGSLDDGTDGERLDAAADCTGAGPVRCQARWCVSVAISESLIAERPRGVGQIKTGHCPFLFQPRRWRCSQAVPVGRSCALTPGRDRVQLVFQMQPLFLERFQRVIADRGWFRSW